jgi:hypothetical protein
VTLSSNEAEYVAMLEAVNEICCIYFLVKGMGVDVKLLIVVRCDNVGAIFMAENSSSGIRTLILIPDIILFVNTSKMD